MPKRIQRSRARGWRMPEEAVYVGRPTKWGNPFRVGLDGSARDCVGMYRTMAGNNIWTSPYPREIKEQLCGKDLVCWCPLVDEDGNRVPCHADVLLELANA